MLRLRGALNFGRKFDFSLFLRLGHSAASRPSSDEISLNIPEGTMDSSCLKNGMRLICEHKEDCCVTAVGCFLPAGSIHEYPEERGAALFMEHLIFRKTRCKNPEDIDLELGTIGAKLSATAMRDVFLFHGIVPSYDFEKLMGLLAEIILDGIICDEDVERERAVILRRLEQVEKNFEETAMDYLPTLAYQGTELARSIYPETCIIENMTALQINNFKMRLLDLSKMTMISTGGTPCDDFQSIAERYFDADSCSDPCGEEEVRLDHVYPESLSFRYTGSDMRHRNDDEEYGYVAMAVEGPGHQNCDDHCALTVAKEFVGQWSIGDAGYKNNAPVLAQEAFEEQICRLYKSFNIGWHCTGLFGCYFVCEKMKLEEFAASLQTEWMRLCTSVTSKEVARAVNQCKMKELMSVHTASDRFHDIAMSIYHCGNYQTFNERLARFDRVSLSVLKQVADKYIYDQCPVVVALGRVENLPDYNTIRSYMYQLRR